MFHACWSSISGCFFPVVEVPDRPLKQSNYQFHTHATSVMSSWTPQTTPQGTPRNTPARLLVDSSCSESFIVTEEVEEDLEDEHLAADVLVIKPSLVIAAPEKKPQRKRFQWSRDHLLRSFHKSPDDWPGMNGTLNAHNSILMCHNTDMVRKAHNLMILSTFA